MTSIGDLLCRTEHLLEKYERYGATHTGSCVTSRETGGFEEEVRAVETEIKGLAKQAEDIADLKNRAIVAAKNAEIRRAKAHITQTRLPELQRKLRKGKNLTSVILQERQQTLCALDDAVKVIPDGIRLSSRSSRVATSNRASAFTRIDKPDSIRGDEYQHTEETRQFEEDWEASKKRQDEALNRIERGVGVLGNLARDMNQEVELQNPVLDAMEDQLDRVGSEIKTRNQQLRDILRRMGRPSNICMDVTLILVLLALAAYIYSLVS